MKTETVNAISSLITVNHQRNLGYHNAAETTADPDLKVLLNYLSEQGREFTRELTQCVQTEDPGMMPVVENNNSIISIENVASTNQNRTDVLSSCEFREDAAKRTYDEVMEHTEYISPEVYEVMCKHRTELQRTHSTVKSLYFTF